MTTIYLDTCALNRLTDDQTQPRIRAEAQAMERVLDLVSAGQVLWIASSVIRAELQRNPSISKREVSLALLTFASKSIEPDPSIYLRASALESEGYGAFDALHLALAERAQSELLLTVDDRFIARATRTRTNLLPSVLNPLDWLQRRAQWPLLPRSTR